MLEWAGISFGEDFTLKLQKSLKKLALMSGAKSLEFIGKIFGTKKDYWIVRGVLDYIEEPEGRDYDMEARGTGTNAHVYWVTDNVLNDWI